MWRYTLVRILSAIPVIAIVGVITFSIIHIAPGDPAAIIGGDEATVEDLERIREELGPTSRYMFSLSGGSVV